MMTAAVPHLQALRRTALKNGKSNQQLEVSCSALEQSSILEPLMIDVGSGEAKNNSKVCSSQSRKI